MFLCEQQGEEERCELVDTYTAPTRHWLRHVSYHSVDTFQNWGCLIQNRIARHMWLKTYVRFPINYQTLHSSSEVEEIKHALMHMCTTFSGSSQFHHFLLSARSGFSGEVNCSTAHEIVNERCCQVSKVFRKTQEVKRGKSGMLLGNWDTG